MRLDLYLVAHGYFESRNRAIEAIKSGKITVNTKHVKPSHQITDDERIEISDDKFYVSRAALKLQTYLHKYPVDLRGRKALDIGSSTGGFTEVLLEYGVSSVDCVDVGSNQLHPSLRNNQHVHVYEQTDIREFESASLYDIIVSDVSFISLHHIISHIDRLRAPKCDIILLFKPQFEVGKETKRDKKGVVTDQLAISKARDRFELACLDLGWQPIRQTPSTLKGKEGNTEWIYHFCTI